MIRGGPLSPYWGLLCTSCLGACDTSCCSCFDSGQLSLLCAGGRQYRPSIRLHLALSQWIRAPEPRSEAGTFTFADTLLTALDSCGPFPLRPHERQFAAPLDKPWWPYPLLLHLAINRQLDTWQLILWPLQFMAQRVVWCFQVVARVGSLLEATLFTKRCQDALDCRLDRLRTLALNSQPVLPKGKSRSKKVAKPAPLSDQVMQPMLKQYFVQLSCGKA